MYALAQMHVTTRNRRNDDEFTLNCRPTVPVGCEEQVSNAKCTRPFVPLVKGLAPRLSRGGRGVGTPYHIDPLQIHHKVLHSRKIWRELSLVDWPQSARTKISQSIGGFKFGA
jgi:hypothetical protein